MKTIRNVTSIRLRFLNYFEVHLANSITTYKDILSTIVYRIRFLINFENEGGDKQIYMSSECQQTWEQLVSYADSSVYQDGGSSEENSQQDRDDLDSNDQDDNQDDDEDDDEDSKINSSDRQDDTESEAYNTEPPSISEFNNNLDDLNVIPNSKTKLK